MNKRNPTSRKTQQICNGTYAPAAMMPGFFIASVVIVGCPFKNYMGW